MAMNLRLSAEGEALLDELAADRHQSKTAVIETALCELAARGTHRTRVAAAFDRIRTEDAELLERLSR